MCGGERQRQKDYASTVRVKGIKLIWTCLVEEIRIQLECH